MGDINYINNSSNNMQYPKDKVIHRLKIAHGHLSKIIKMVEADEYCIDIVHQLLAVQSALKKTDEIVLEDHLKTCVSESIKKGDSDEAIKEVMSVFKKKE